MIPTNDLYEPIELSARRYKMSVEELHTHLGRELTYKYDPWKERMVVVGRLPADYNSAANKGMSLYEMWMGFWNFSVTRPRNPVDALIWVVFFPILAPVGAVGMLFLSISEILKYITSASCIPLRTMCE